MNEHDEAWNRTAQEGDSADKLAVELAKRVIACLEDTKLHNGGWFASRYARALEALLRS